MRTPGFKITNTKGFHVTFDNLYTVSVQFGGLNHCDNYNDPVANWGKSGEKGCANAEIAVIDPRGDLIEIPPWIEGDTVRGYITPKQLLEVLNAVEALPKND